MVNIHLSSNSMQARDLDNRKIVAGMSAAQQTLAAGRGDSPGKIG